MGEFLFPELENDENTVAKLLSNEYKVRKFIGVTDIIYSIYDPNSMKSLYSCAIDRKYVE